jgi:hypothetical protein
LIGIISIGDLVKTIIAEQQCIIEQLEHYSSGSYCVSQLPCQFGGVGRLRALHASRG